MEISPTIFIYLTGWLELIKGTQVLPNLGRPFLQSPSDAAFCWDFLPRDGVKEGRALQRVFYIVCFKVELVLEVSTWTQPIPLDYVVMCREWFRKTSK